MSPIQIGDRWVGKNWPCLIVAEIGLNHNGEMALARQMIDAVAELGADAVKCQTYRTEDFIADRSLTYEYVSQGKTVVESQYEMFKRCELSQAALSELKTYSEQRGLIFHSTPTSETGVGDLVRLGVPVLKNGSDYLTHLPLIQAMGRTGLPTVLSTGMATLAEIDDAVRTFRETGNERLILLHCVSAYPTPFEEVHLRKMPTLAAAFGCLVGFSDHTQGVASAVGAAALGACWIEKHFTLDKGLPGPDHRFSSDTAEFRELVEAVRAVESCLGEECVKPTLGEMRGRRDFRLSCVAACDLPAGHLLTSGDITFCRPGTGLPPKALDWLIGQRLGHAVTSGQVLEGGDFQ